MPQLSLNPPSTFKAKAAIPMAGGKPVEVEFEFKHRTKTEADEFRDSLSDMDDVSAVEAMLVGWSLADEFTSENVRRLVESYPGSAFAIGAAYLRELYGLKKPV